MAKRETSMGYPGVFPNPNNQEGPPPGELVQILNQDGANTLIKTKDGETRIVPNSWIKRG